MKLRQNFLIAAIIILAACNIPNKLVVSQPDLVGNWLLKGKGPGYPTDNTLITNLIIREDNTYQFVHAGSYNGTVAGKYTLSGNELKFEARPGYVETYQIVSLNNKRMEVTVRKQNVRSSSELEQVLFEKVSE